MSGDRSQQMLVLVTLYCVFIVAVIAWGWLA